MRGIDVSAYNTAMYDDFECLSIGIGDGGNEIGCGGIKLDSIDDI